GPILQKQMSDLFYEIRVSWLFRFDSERYVRSFLVWRALIGLSKVISPNQIRALALLSVPLRSLRLSANLR
ncbi:hypothetical protein, partial [Paenibacillus sp. TCA20]|uniref:hypothetical protein n=1 Tax=Paenibacillus sp. TCA20 TaxID=1499968 RepID=UPI001EE66665